MEKGIVSKTTFEPTRVPMPTFKSSCNLLGSVDCITDIAITRASGNAPRVGSNKPPTRPGPHTRSSKSEPSEIHWAPFPNRNP